jgi:hypothetical protein
MNQRRISFGLALFVVAGIGGLAAVNAREVDSDEKQLLTELLNATEDGDYDSFVEDGSPEFKAKLTKQMFAGVSAMLSPRLKKGYEAAYLGSLRQQGCAVYLWKLAYKDGGDDTLAKLVVKNAKVAGFWLQ